MWFKTQYTKMLEQRVKKLEQELSASQLYTGQLVERLLQKSGAPAGPLKPLEPLDPKIVANMLETAAIFEESDNNDPTHDEITDNRKDKYDSLVS